MNDNVEILLIDDDEVDVELVRRSLARHELSHRLLTARDGVEGLELLRSRHRDSHRASTVVLLDLNMPRMSGLEVLQELRADEALKRTVVFILSTSDSEADRMAAYDKNVAGYLLKRDLGTEECNVCDLLRTYTRSNLFPPYSIAS